MSDAVEPARPLAPPPARPPAPTGSGRLALFVAVLALTMTTALWWQTRSELARLRESTRQVATDLAALRDLPVIDVTGAPALGAEDAVVTLVEYSDYECPFCIRHFTSTMPLIEEAFIGTGQLRYVFRDLPIAQLHPGAARAHEAGRCAAEQDRFWPLHARLFSPAGTHDDGALEAQAGEAGLDLQAFRACLSSGRMRPGVESSVASAASLGASGTPGGVGGIRVVGAHQGGGARPPGP